MPIRYLLFLFIYTILPIQPFAQSQVKVTRDSRTVGGSTEVTFTAFNSSPARQTIILSLNGGSYKGADGPLPVIETLIYGQNKLITLKEVNGAPGYSYSYAEGCLNVKPAEVTYLLPISPGKSTRLDTLYNINNAYFGKQQPENWLAYTIETKPGDTIFSSRRGKIIEVESKEISSFKNGLSYSSQRTHLTIEHKDCTRAKYELFEKDGIFVEPGDDVGAGEPLGIIGDGEAYINGSHLRFSVFYPDLSPKVLKELASSQNYRYSYAYLSPLFAEFGIPVVGENYVCKHPEKVIFQEMRKKEIKNWLKNRGNQ